MRFLHAALKQHVTTGHACFEKEKNFMKNTAGGEN